MFVVVGSVQGISGTGCAVLARRYDLRGNSQEDGKQRQKQLQMEPRDSWHLSCSENYSLI